MAESQSGGDKTESATPKRRADARKEGNVAKSQELTQSVMMLCASVFLAKYAPYLMKTLAGITRTILANCAKINISYDNLQSYGAWLIVSFFRIVAPFMAFIFVIAFLVTYCQVGNLVKEFKFDMKRLNPFKGLKGVFSVKTVVKFVVDIIKLLIIGVFVVKATKTFLPEILNLTDVTVAQIVSFIGRMIYWMFLRVFFYMFLIALLDFAFQRWKYEEDLKMTKQEVKDEMKSREGDPQVKAKIRQIQMQMARQRMFSEIPEADVVITNPIHYAIAVKYDMQAMGAPRVVAKGARMIAQRIKEIARENNVPIVENKPLARALYKSVDLGEEVPGKLYQAVAEVLAYVYQLNQQKMDKVNQQFSGAV